MDNLKLFLAVNNRMETERLRLRPITLKDAEDMFEYASNNAHTYFIFPTHRTLDDTKHSIATYFMAEPLGKFGIELKDENKLIGTIDLRVDMSKQKAEIGYVINPKYGKQGYTTEAANRLMKFAFEELELEKVVSSCDERNSASEAVMRKLGMQKEGVSRHHELWKNGEWVNMLFYSILREEYVANN